MCSKIEYHTSIFQKYRTFTNLIAQSKTAKYFLRIKGHTRNIFSYELEKTKGENQS